MTSDLPPGFSPFHFFSPGWCEPPQAGALHLSTLVQQLDARARDLLAEGRGTFARYELGTTHLLPWAGGTLLFPWKGDRVLDTLVIWLSSLGRGVSREGVALVFSDAGPDRVREECARLAAEPPPDPVELAAAVINKKTEKFHLWLSEELLTLDLASRALDVAGAWEVVGRVG